MNFRIILICLALTLSMSGALHAQTEEPREAQAEEKNPIEKIVEESEGNVEIIMSDDLLEQILATPKVGTQRPSSGQHSRQSGARRTGYRIQVFSDGHNPSSLQARAKARGSAISARLPKYRGQVYSYSQAPNWYTRVGNFQTSAEASRALGELKRAFPQYAGEMRVVRCQITIIR